MDDKYNNIDPIYEPDDLSETNATNDLTGELYNSPYTETDSDDNESKNSSSYRKYRPYHTSNKEETYGQYRENFPANPPSNLSQVESKPIKQKKRFKFFRFVAVFLVLIFLSGIIFGAGYTTAIYLGNRLTPDLIKEDNKTLSFDVNQIENVLSTSTSQETENSIVAIAETAGPSVVTVTSTIQYNYNSFFGNQIQETQATGSGVIYKTTDDKLLIITNHHVIANASNVEVTMHDGVSVLASILGFDSRMDLAVLSIPLVNLEKAGSGNITLATFGDSENLKVGETAVAIGNPLGKEYSSTVTAGVISAINRQLNIDGADLTLLQTDAAINPGNSGGALVDSKGEVIGINTAKYVDESVEGMGFSIPIHLALPVIENIIDSGSGSDIAYEIKGDKPFLGVRISDIDDDIYSETQMPFGVYIVEVYENSAAEEAGIQAGDVLYSLDGHRLMNSEDLFDALSTNSVGDSIKISLSRGNENIHITAVLTKYSDVVTD